MHGPRAPARAPVPAVPPAPTRCATCTPPCCRCARRHPGSTVASRGPRNSRTGCCDGGASASRCRRTTLLQTKPLTTVRTIQRPAAAIHRRHSREGGNPWTWTHPATGPCSHWMLAPLMRTAVACLIQASRRVRPPAMSRTQAPLTTTGQERPLDALRRVGPSALDRTQAPLTKTGLACPLDASRRVGPSALDRQQAPLTKTGLACFGTSSPRVGSA